MKRKSLKIISSVLTIGIIFSSFVGCSKSNENIKNNNKISISGSTSVGPLMEKLAEVYEENNRDTSIEINQVGSSAGIKDAINGISEIGMASRELKDKEKKELNSTVIAYDGIAIITNKNNPIKNITIDQLRNIYTGKITNWNQIQEGVNKEIVVTSREDGSGTREAFQDLVGFKAEELKPDAMISNGNGGLKEMVVGNENAIAFVSFEYLDDSVNVVKINDVEPTADNVRNGSYKISRPFLLVTKDDVLSENGRKLIDYILSDEGQKIVLDNKLIPIK